MVRDASLTRLLAVVAAAVLLGACSTGRGGGSGSNAALVLRPGAADTAVLNGSGSTLAAGVMADWIRQYRAVAPGVTINFKAVDARTAAAELQSGTADFGISESPVPPAGTSGFAAVPSVGTAVVVAYNVPGVPNLRLSAGTVAGIFAGTITSWDAPDVAADNPGTPLPALGISVVDRSDPAGATLVLSQYLQSSAPGRWTAGSGTTVAWPVGTGVAGPEAMTAAIRQRPGAVGYASAGEAIAAGLDRAQVKNAGGQFSVPTADTIDTFLLTAVGTPQDLVLKVGYDSPAPASYPLSAFSYLLVPKGPPPTPKDTALRNFVRWVLSEGQRSPDRVDAAPLPLPLMVRTLEALQSNDLRPKR